MIRSRLLQRQLTRKYTPLSLFSNGEVGGWYDPSDLSTLFQDTSGNIPVENDGDPVGLMLDKSGNEKHATQNEIIKKPIYRTDGKIHWIELSDSNNLRYFKIPDDTTGTTTDSPFATFSIFFKDNPAFPYILGGTSDRGMLMLFNGNSDNIRFGITTIAGNYVASGTTVWTDKFLIYSAQWTRSLGRIRAWGNGVLEVDESFGEIDLAPNRGLTIGSRGAGTERPILADLYGGLIINRNPTDNERIDLEKYLAKKSGRIL